jgi:hypothetical protein
MNFGRVAAAAVIAWLVYMGLSPLVNNALLADLYAQHPGVFRTAGQMNLVVGFAASLVGFFVFAYAYARGYEGGNRAMEGLRFGVVVGLLVGCFAIVWNYVVLPISGLLALAWVVDTIVEMGIYGVVVGLVYKPLRAR